jgi:hypothetical protein
MAFRVFGIILVYAYPRMQHVDIKDSWYMCINKVVRTTRIYIVLICKLEEKITNM